MPGAISPPTSRCFALGSWLACACGSIGSSDPFADASGTPSTRGDSVDDAPQSSSDSQTSEMPTSATANESGSDPATSVGGDSTTTTTTTTTGSASDDGTGDADCLGFDDNGVAQLYCTDPAGAPQWVLGFDDWEDRIAQFGAISGDGANTIVEESGQVRMGVAADDFECDGLEDHGLALEQGYMCTPLDWTDYEMTGYFQLVEASGDDGNQDFTMYGGGGRHTGDGPPEGCWGSAYKGSYHYVAGEVRFGKESWHVNYDYRDGWIGVDAGPDLSRDSQRWIGMKLVRYRFERDGAAGIRNELWLDLAGVDDDGMPANDWQLATVSEDHPDQPSWGSQATDCDAPADDQIMFWGGPHVTWRWDDTTARLRLMSVREIIAPE